MNLGTFWAFLAVALPVLASLLAPLPSTDLTYHLRAGAEILDTGRIPTVDTWTFTAAGQPWFDQQWGAQVLLAGIYRVAGWTGLVVFRALLVGAAFGLLLVLCRRRGVGVRVSAWLVLGAFTVAAPALALRPQLIAIALFAATLLLVSERHARPWTLWLVFPITLLWANVHGSFFLAPVVIGLAWLADLGNAALAGTARHRSLVVAVVAGLAACVTPHGPAVWVYAVVLGSNPEVTRRISEWQPTSLRDVEGIVFFASALLVALFLARRGRATPWATLAWLGFFFLIGTYAARGIAWWPFAAVAAVAPLLAAVPGELVRRVDPRPIRFANGAIAAILVLVGVALLPLWRPTDLGLGAPQGVLSQAPAELTIALRDVTGPNDRLFNVQRWGSWFQFALPELPVAIDSRIELFPAAVWDDYETVLTGGDGWETILDEWDVTLVTTEEGDAAFEERLADAGWARAVDAAEGSLFVRTARP